LDLHVARHQKKTKEDLANLSLILKEHKQFRQHDLRDLEKYLQQAHQEYIRNVLGNTQSLSLSVL
jgi:hypothetical protein